MANNSYNYDISRSFVNWSILWGGVAVLVGILIAFQLVVPSLNLPPFLTYGRLRPLQNCRPPRRRPGNA